MITTTVIIHWSESTTQSITPLYPAPAMNFSFAVLFLKNTQSYSISFPKIHLSHLLKKSRWGGSSHSQIIHVCLTVISTPLISCMCRPRCWYQLAIFSTLFAQHWIQPVLRRFTPLASSFLPVQEADFHFKNAALVQKVNCLTQNRQLNTYQ